MKKLIEKFLKWIKGERSYPINHPKCLKEIDAVIRNLETVEGIKHARGQRSDAFLSLEAKGLMMPIKLIDELMLIKDKRSNLPLSERRLVIAITSEGIKNTINKRLKK